MGVCSHYAELGEKGRLFLPMRSFEAELPSPPDLLGRIDHRRLRLERPCIRPRPPQEGPLPYFSGVDYVVCWHRLGRSASRCGDH